MELRLIKLNHQKYQLLVMQEGQVVLDRVLEVRSMLRHDIMHFCVEKTASLKSSFFGQFKYGLVENDREIMQTELVVSILQGIDKDENFDESTYLDRATQAFLATGGKVPAYLSCEFISKVRWEYLNILRQYHQLQTGPANFISLEF